MHTGKWYFESKLRYMCDNFKCLILTVAHACFIVAH